MTSTLRRWLPLTVLALVLVAALAVGTTSGGGHATTADRVQRITRQLKCPVCSGETVADSNAPISKDIRAAVQQRVEAGESDGSVTAYIVRQYPGTRLKPPTNGVGLIVWLLPVMAFAAAAIGLALAFVRWRSRPGVVVTDEDRALVDRAKRS